MLTLSYGFLKPQTNDRGSIFWPALEFNIQQLNDHVHDGVDSAKLTSASSVAIIAPVPSGSWGSILADGSYRQNIALPASMSFDDVQVNIRTSAGKNCAANVEKISGTHFYVYCNDPSQDLEAVITS